jgi:uncharacterized protein (DUF952 family)
MPLIYHITTAEAWHNAQATGSYEADSLREEGFIHCSEAYQVEDTLQRYFNGRQGLVKLFIDTDRLSSQYIQEWSGGAQDTFPHIYGPINLEAVLAVEPLGS